MDDPGQALVDVVDADDRVIGTATRARMRAEALRHRAVYVVVRTTDDSIVVHRRADWKDVHPGAWDLCFGGVLDAGEGWDHAAARELAEEAGIDAPLRPLGIGTYEGDGAPVNGRVYEAVHDGPYPCPDGEVVEVRTVPLQALPAFLADHRHCPDSAELVLPLLFERT
ncbi:MAG: NUDIX domain-containing protein [Acidimicrobiia bacterium]